ncbi:hypothetical protein GWI33_007105 [Rhynchophorus ferrugineus]|uniref:Uncharacterized protein n=1 Tax=Rhynchophorus ferrugineus TaxID=354439 RepID=A0A834MDD7_RHYFE|nr:hypothetical protein GWI33_007105 [Rhynchophorus ferrugineus]
MLAIVNYYCVKSFHRSWLDNPYTTPQMGVLRPPRLLFELDHQAKQVQTSVCLITIITASTTPRSPASNKDTRTIRRQKKRSDERL